MLSKSWAEGRLPADLRLTDGRRIQVVYPGVWSNSNGPDFLGALLDIDGRLARGDVEIHLRSSDWERHRHAENTAYAGVLLHAVGVDDAGSEVRGVDGAPIPTLVLGAYMPELSGDQAERLPRVFARLGEGVCLPTAGATYPSEVRRVLRDQGWLRLVEKQLAFGQALVVSTASEVLYRGLLDALGYSANREGMAALAERIPLALLETWIENGRGGDVPATMLGAAGFLPLSPALLDVCGIGPELARTLESDFDRIARDYATAPLAPSAWTLNRVRPQNHPAARLASLASLILQAAPDGLLATFLALPLDNGRSWDGWLARASPAIGASRRRQISANVLAPFMAAYAEVMFDDELAEEVAELWELLPGAVDDQITRQTRRQIVGDARFPVKYALEEQGLHRIHRNGCRQLRCFECPIAALAVQREPWDSGTSGAARS